MGMTGIDGFLGTRGSLGMDVLVVGLLAVLPLLAWSIHVVRTRRDYVTHKRLQLAIAAALLVCIVIFEIDVRLVSDWKERARPSPWWPGGVLTMLGIHLIFAVSTLVLWVWTIWEGLVRFPSPPVPGSHGGRHRVMGRLAALDLVVTTITGLLFYWLAFIA
jgi:putative membrane protein